MATLRQLEQALVAADAAGDGESARRLAPLVAKYRGDVSSIPGFEDNEIPELRVQPTETTVGDEIIGAGETALTLGTGATGGALGMIGGTLKGIAEEMLSGDFGSAAAAERVQKLALEGAQAFTYAPRTQAGQEQVQAIGEVAQHLPPIVPAATELAMAGQSVRQAVAPAIRANVIPPVQQAATRAKQSVSQAAERLRQVVPETRIDAKDGGSVGAMAIDAGTRRQMLSDELPIPIKLTKGQKTRDFGDQRFERETAKMSEEGGLLRERFEQQNMQLQYNVDAFIDSTGAQIFENRGVGEMVDKVLVARRAKDKAKVRTLYKKAEKDGEMKEPVAMDSLVKHISESGPEAEVANVLKTALAKAAQLGVIETKQGMHGLVAVRTADGNLIPKPVSLKNAELFRKSINMATDMEPTNIRQASIMKGLVDDATEGAGGDAYKKARKARAKMGRDYQDSHLVKSLLGTKARTADRAVALEDMVRKIVLNPSTSLDQMRHVRKLLQTKTGGVKGEGAQAWRELQGATLRHIQDQMTKNVARNQQGDPIVSASNLDKVITNLDKSGKLDYIFGPDGADQLRVINDVAKDVLTAPPGAVNASNTATVLAGLMDVAISGSTGVPAPLMTSFNIMTKSIKDKKLKARVKKALGE